MFLTIIIFISFAHIPFAKITAVRGANERHEMDLMGGFSAAHRYSKSVSSILTLKSFKWKERGFFFPFATFS